VGWYLAHGLAGRLAARSGRGPAALARASVGGLVALGCAGLLAGALAVGNPLDRAEREVDAFVQLDQQPDPESPQSRLTSGGGNRYDYWRIALDEFASAPIVGIGAGNYERDYFKQRRTLEDVTQPHSLELQFLAELGLVGGIALLVFLGGVIAGARRRLREARRHEREIGLLVAALGVFVTWLVHTSVDWLHVLPGITGVALAAAAVLVAPWTRQRVVSGRRQVLPVAACAVAVVLGGVMVGRWALADRYTGQAEEALASDPGRAAERADAALELNDESLRTYYAKAAAYARLDDYERARATLAEAARREPSDFVPWALLGDLAFRRGDIEASKRYYLRAWKLNPRDSLLGNYAFDPRFGEGRAASGSRAP
jgi:hypothetical protein